MTIENEEEEEDEEEAEEEAEDGDERDNRGKEGEGSDRWSRQDGLRLLIWRTTLVRGRSGWSFGGTPVISSRSVVSRLVHERGSICSRVE